MKKVEATSEKTSLNSEIILYSQKFHLQVQIKVLQKDGEPGHSQLFKLISSSEWLFEIC